MSLGKVKISTTEFKHIRMLEKDPWVLILSSLAQKKKKKKKRQKDRDRKGSVLDSIYLKITCSTIRELKLKKNLVAT